MEQELPCSPTRGGRGKPGRWHRPEGRLRIGAPVTFARRQVGPELGAFHEAPPTLRVELVLEDRPMDLGAEHLDAALRLGAPPDAALVAQADARGAVRGGEPGLARAQRHPAYASGVAGARRDHR
jgi:DNA-binding transcriptional LysR family regulator